MTNVRTITEGASTTVQTPHRELLARAERDTYLATTASHVTVRVTGGHSQLH